MLEPERNAEKINAFISDPSINPWIQGDAEINLDIRLFFNGSKNFFFCSDHGGCCFLHQGGGIYDLHSFVLPSGRGAWMKKMANQAFDWIFKNTDANCIVTSVPRNNIAAIGATRILGMKKYGTKESVWKQGGKEFFMDMYSIYKDEFVGAECH